MFAKCTVSLGPKGNQETDFKKAYPLWQRSLHHCLIKSHNFWMQSQWSLIFPFYRRNDGWCSQCWHEERPELNPQTSYPVAIPLYQNGNLLPKQSKLLLWRTLVYKQDSTRQRNIQARKDNCGTQLSLMPSTWALPGYKACSSWTGYYQASPQGFPTCTCLGNSSPSRIRDHWVRSAARTFSGLPSFSSQTLEVLDDGQSRMVLTSLP